MATEIQNWRQYFTVMSLGGCVAAVMTWKKLRTVYAIET